MREILENGLISTTLANHFNNLLCDLQFPLTEQQRTEIERFVRNPRRLADLYHENQGFLDYFVWQAGEN
jgi:hypothetical protein